MPIGGVVIAVVPADRQKTEMMLGRLENLLIYGNDEKGNIIAALNGKSRDDIRNMVRKIEQIDAVLRVNLAYLKDEEKADGSTVDDDYDD